jgi:hypothetical protein
MIFNEIKIRFFTKKKPLEERDQPGVSFLDMNIEGINQIIMKI